MLFAVKNCFAATLLLLILFVVGAVAARMVLALHWDLEFRPTALLLGMIALATSDGFGHGLLTLVLGDRYRRHYRALVEFFRPQGVREILAGGLLAGGEELVFRGVLLEGLRSLMGLSPGVAIALTSLVFGAAHVLPTRMLLPFALWAVWEGALLGIVYAMSGSLLVTVILHVLHDLAGFSLFAFQRRSGWLL
jgi:membrane protease YdiL (CAAX protease family)